MFIMKRKDNKRIFGGWFKQSLTSSGGYYRGNTNTWAFLWRVTPGKTDDVCGNFPRARLYAPANRARLFILLLLLSCWTRGNRGAREWGAL